MKIVYIAHPIGVTNWEENIRLVSQICKTILLENEHVVPFAPYVPYIMSLNDKIDFERKRGMAATLHLMHCCKELWVYGDFISPGMKDEIRQARQLGIAIVNRSEKITSAQINAVV